MRNKFLQFLGLTKRAGKLLEGYNKCEDGIKYKKVKLLILSKEISQNTKEKFIRYCSTNRIEIIQGFASEELSNSLGTVNINVIGVTDEKMSTELIKLWKELIEN